jgi:hypothetical protein
MRNLSFVRFGLSAAVLALCCVTGAARQAPPDEEDKTADARSRPAPRFTDWSAPVNLGPPVSTAATELTPFLARNGRDLFFASNREAGSGPTDLYVSRRQGRGGEWGEPVSLGPAINTPVYGEFGPALSRDGRYLLFVSDRPGGCGASDIYVARRLSRDGYTQWSEPQNLGCEVNSTGIELSPSLFENVRGDDDDGDDTGRAGRTVHLYFSSGLRPGGLGFGDIYVSQLQADGTFGPASPVVEFNTPFNEIRPNIRRRDGLEIFFDSNRPGSLGGSADLYVSTRECTTCPWAAPVNLGPAVNSAAVDGGASLSFDGTELYFMSNRPGGAGGQDIYVIERRRLTGGDPD